MNRSLLLALAIALATAVVWPAPAFAESPPLDFNRDVRPILSENCFACHGFDEAAREADLRLDVAESALADRDGVPAIVAGDPDASEAWRRITSDDESEVMPPVDSHRELTAERLAAELQRLCAGRGKLLALAERARLLARPNAALELAAACRPYLRDAA
mgnify:CR=1 FL=1